MPEPNVNLLIDEVRLYLTSEPWPPEIYSLGIFPPMRVTLTPRYDVDFERIYDVAHEQPTPRDPDSRRWDFWRAWWLLASLDRLALLNWKGFEPPVAFVYLPASEFKLEWTQLGAWLTSSRGREQMVDAEIQAIYANTPKYRDPRIRRGPLTIRSVVENVQLDEARNVCIDARRALLAVARERYAPDAGEEESPEAIVADVVESASAGSGLGDASSGGEAPPDESPEIPQAELEP